MTLRHDLCFMADLKNFPPKWTRPLLILIALLVGYAVGHLL